MTSVSSWYDCHQATGTTAAVTGKQTLCRTVTLFCSLSLSLSLSPQKTAGPPSGRDHLLISVFIVDLLGFNM